MRIFIIFILLFESISCGTDHQVQQESENMIRDREIITSIRNRLDESSRIPNQPMVQITRNSIYVSDKIGSYSNTITIPNGYYLSSYKPQINLDKHAETKIASIQREGGDIQNLLTDYPDRVPEQLSGLEEIVSQKKDLNNSEIIDCWIVAPIVISGELTDKIKLQSNKPGFIPNWKITSVKELSIMGNTYFHRVLIHLIGPEHDSSNTYPFELSILFFGNGLLTTINK
jgi:hypothetical protein